MATHARRQHTHVVVLDRTHAAYLGHDTIGVLVHHDEKGDVARKLPQQGGKQVDAKDVGVGALGGQALQRLGVGDAEEQACSEKPLQRRLWKHTVVSRRKNQRWCKLPI